MIMAAIGDSIQRYPLLRLLLPYIAGIVVADVLWPYIAGWWFYGIGACAVLLLFIRVLGASRHRVWVSGLAVSLFFFLLGELGSSLSRMHTQYTWPFRKAVYEARVVDTPQRRARSMLCEMEVDAVLDSTAWHRVGRKVLAYMQPTAAADSLKVGDRICFRGRVRTPKNFSDNLAFDYARYVTLQGAAGTVYLPEEDWHRTGEDSLSLRERMLRLRHMLHKEYMRPAFEGDALGVLSALTLGDRSGLSEEVRAAYADAGVAHVLALSGLHVGVIYAMLAFLMRGVLRRRELRWLREILTIAVLWLFALMVGMSASVVRAVTMCTLYILSRWVSGESNSINVLSLAALLMLFVHPLYLFDVGFQLSFMAMAAILWLEPHLEVLFHRSSLHPILAYFVGVVCMSLAAQLGTFPLTLYHFGTFPTYFLVTNLVVIPYLYAVLMLCVAWWASAIVGFPWATALGHGVQLLVDWMNDFLAWIGHWSGALLHVEGYNALAVLFTYLFILFTGFFLVKRWPRGIVLALASLLGLLLQFLF